MCASKLPATRAPTPPLRAMRWVAEMVFGSLALFALWVFVRDRRAAASRRNRDPAPPPQCRARV